MHFLFTVYGWVVEEPVDVGDVVVVGSRPGGGYYLYIPSAGAAYSISQERYNQLRADGGSGGGPRVIDADAEPENGDELIVSAVTLVKGLLELLADSPLLSAAEQATVNQLVEALDTSSTLYDVGQIDTTTLKSQVEGALEIALGQVGDALGSMITSAVIASTATTASAPAGPNALVIGAGGVAIGVGVAATFPAGELATLLTDLIFGLPEAIQAIESGLDIRINELYQDINDWIYRNAPDGAKPVFRQLSDNADSIVVDGVSVFEGDARLNLADFSTALAGVSVNLSLSGVQSTGGAGAARMVTVEGIIGSSFNDTLIGDDFDNIFVGGLGNDTINGGAGFDTVDYSTSTNAVTVNLALLARAQNTGQGLDHIRNVEAVIGSAHADMLTGSGGGNTLIGGSGNDVLNGAAGDDLLYANGVGSSFGETNTLNGGAGYDTASYEQEVMSMTVYIRDNQFSSSGRAYFNAQATVFDVLQAVEGIRMGSGNDTVFGDSSANVISGGAGSDSLMGMDGDDHLEGGAGDDFLLGGQGRDTATYAGAASGVTVDLSIFGDQNTIGAGTDQLSQIENLTGSLFGDTLKGNGAENILFGSRGEDEIRGEGGDDVLDGGEGADELYGGAGSDFFVYSSAHESFAGARDVIFDFEVGVDKIDLVALLDGSSSGLSFAEVGGSTFVEALDQTGALLSVELRGVLGVSASDVRLGYVSDEQRDLVPVYPNNERQGPFLPDPLRSVEAEWWM